MFTFEVVVVVSGSEGAVFNDFPNEDNFAII